MKKKCGSSRKCQDGVRKSGVIDERFYDLFRRTSQNMLEVNVFGLMHKLQNLFSKEKA